MLEFLAGSDQSLFLIINRDLSYPLLDPLFVAVTDGRFWIVPLVVLAAVILKLDARRAAVAIGLALVTVAITDPVCCRLLKPMFGRPRPCHPDFLVEGGRFLLGLKRSLAMPSAHAMNSFGQAALFSRLYPKATPFVYLVASLVSFSRIYVGVHYPADVVLGAASGICVGTVVYSTFFVVIANSRRVQPGSPGVT